MVFYRKYRPQSLQELIGQIQVKETLSNAFLEKKLSHAYLFCGPRGTGKTSTARILAKMVNCETTKRVEADSNAVNIPCNKCAQCLSVTDGSNLDLIEIDAASNRGIDDIRLLRENLKLTPAKAFKKVYIIDEVHMLTSEAFNALLKTLEEPPEHVMFILATTEANKIPATILSRVTKLDFNLAADNEVFEALDKVAQAEKIEIDQDALSLLSQKAEGSFRDALKLLDQLACQGVKITTSLVESSIQGGEFASLVKLLELIWQKDARLALELLGEQIKQGVNAREYTISMLELLRSVMFLKHNVSEVALAANSKRHLSLTRLAQNFSLEDVVKLVNLLQKAYEQLRFSPITSLPLEIAIVESCQTQVQQVQITQETQIVQTIPEAKEAILPEIKMVVVGPSAVQNDDMAAIIDKWNYILETIRPQNYSLEALLRSVKVLECGEGKILIEVPYSFHQRILETPKSRNLLESVLKDVLSKEMKVKTVLGKRPKRLEELANVEIAADDEIIKIASEIFNSDSP